MKAEMTHFQRHWSFVNMPFTKEDRILIKNLFELKGYNAKHLVREFPEKAKMSAASTSCCNSYGYWLVDRRPSSGRWRSTRIHLVDKLVLQKRLVEK